MTGTAEENERVVREAFDWDRLMARLAHVARAKAEVAEEHDLAERDGPARAAFVCATFVVAEVLGDTLLARAWGRHLPDDAARADQLGQIVDRLMLVLPIASMAEPEHTAASSLSALIREIQAVQNGDHPRLMERVPQPTATRNRRSGGNNNGFRLALLKLDALAWDQRLRARGFETTNVQAMLYEAYGQNYATILGWKRQITRYLGREYMESVLRNAAKETTYTHPFFGAVDFEPEMNDLIQQSSLMGDGQKFRTEYAKRLKAVD